jgi:hypothetical protein
MEKETDIYCEECGVLCATVEFLFRHLRAHGMSSQEYTLKWKYRGERPRCACGCENFPAWNVSYKDFSRYVHGHGSVGKKRTEEERKKIGEKNSINMKNFMSRHPDVAKNRAKILRKGITPEVEKKRALAVKEAYNKMTSDDKLKFSEHTKRLWEDGTLVAAQDKARKTWCTRFNNGEYDFTERNRKISNKITQKYLDGGFEWAQGQYYSHKNSITCNYRSSWELELMEMLDKDDRVTIWKYEPLSISYLDVGVTRRYIPDFYVVYLEKEFLIEVKPQSLSSTKTNSEKRRSALELCEKNGWHYVEWESGDSISELLDMNII